MLSLRVIEYSGEHFNFIVFHAIKLQITLKKFRFFTLNGHFGDGLVRSPIDINPIYFNFKERSANF